MEIKICCNGDSLHRVRRQEIMRIEELLRRFEPRPIIRARIAIDWKKKKEKKRKCHKRGNAVAKNELKLD